MDEAYDTGEFWYGSVKVWVFVLDLDTTKHIWKHPRHALLLVNSSKLYIGLTV